MSRLVNIVIMWYCRHLSSLLVEGRALWCSLASAPVSADYKRVIERSCSYEILWCQLTCVYRDSGKPPPPPHCQRALTRSSLSFRQGSPLHLTSVPPCAVMSTTPPVTCAAVVPSHPPFPVTLSLIGGWHAELSRKWPACMEIKVGSCLLMRQT